MQNKQIYIALMVGIILLFSCSSSRDAVKDDKLKNMSDKELRELLFSKSEIGFDHFYTKIGVEYKGSKSSYTFNATVKMRVDSAFSGTIKYAMVVGGFYLMNQDSMYFVNKGSDCYYQEELTFISTMFGTQIQYEFFQSLLLGKPIGLDEEIKYKQIKSKEDYILSSHKKKDFKKLEIDPTAFSDDEDIFIQYHMAPETFDLTRINIQVPSDTVEINIDYKERKMVDEKWNLPEETIISLYHPRDTISITFDYGSIKINDPKAIRIKIPESYVPCE